MYAKILFLAFATAMLMACSGDPGSTGNNTSGYTTTDSNAHTAQWVTIDIKIATGGVDASDAKVFVQRSYDDAPVLHGTVADLDKDPVKVDIANPEQLWVQISLTKPGFKMGDPNFSGQLLGQGIETLRTSGEKSITMHFPLAIDLTTDKWICEVTQYPHDPETKSGAMWELQGSGTSTTPIYGCGLDVPDNVSSFGLLGYTIVGDPDTSLDATGAVSTDGKSLDFTETSKNTGMKVSAHHCTR